MYLEQPSTLICTAPPSPAQIDPRFAFDFVAYDERSGTASAGRPG